MLGTWRPTRSRVTSLVLNAILGAGVIFFVLLVSPGISTTSDLSILLTIVLLAVVSAVLRPILVCVAALMHPAAALVLGLFAQAVIMYVAISLAPGMSVSSFWWALFAAWLAATLMTLVAWVGDTDETDALLAVTMRHAADQPGVPASDGRSGVLFVQIDGLSAPLLNWMVTAETSRP